MRAMQCQRILPALAAAAMLCCAVTSASASAQRINDILLQELQQRNGVPGMAAAIIQDGRLVWQGHSGLADRERNLPVTATTSFRLASVSKFVTAVMLARLVEQKKIDLLAPVDHYLPDYPAKQYPVTSLQLAAHLSGTPHYDTVLDAARDERKQAFLTVGAGLDIFKHRPLVHRPGSAYLYSSFGFNLLSAVMERAATKDFDAMLGELSARAAAPSLEVELPGNARATWSTLYDTGGNVLPRGNISYNRAGGGMLSNASDLARVGMAALDAHYISQPTLTRFTSPVLLDDGAVVQDGRFNMGIGFRLSVDQLGRRFFHHSGTTAGARSHISIYPEQKMIVAVLSNASWVAAMDSTASALAEQMLGKHRANAPCKAGAFRYKGQYKAKEVRGSLHMVSSGQVCKVTLEADNELGKSLANGAPSRTYTLFGERERMALVTPIGLFPATLSEAAITLTIMGVPVTLELASNG